MKKIKLLFALVIAWMAGAGVSWADDFSVQVGDGVTLQFTPNVENLTCELTKIVMTAEGAVEVPEQVTSDGVTYTVTSIGSGCANTCNDKIKTLSLPKTLTEIGNAAFYHCTKLEDIYLKTRDYNTHFAYYTVISNGYYYDVFPNTNTKFHVTELFYQGLANNLIDERWTQLRTKYNERPELFEPMEPEVGDMALVTMDVVNEAGETVSTRKVIVTLTDINEGKAIIYRPMRDNLYDPATCWVKEAYDADEASYFGNEDPAYESESAKGTLVIPPTITVQNKEYTITGIGGSGFYCNNDAKITGIRIPKTITQIGIYGLAGLQYLNGTLVIPSSVTQIGDPSVDEAHVFSEGVNNGNYYVKNLYFMHRADNIVWYDTDASQYFSDAYLNYLTTAITKSPDAQHSGFGTWRANRTSYFDPSTSGIFFSESQSNDPMTYFEATESGEVSITKLINLFNLPITFSTTNANVAQVKVDDEGEPVLDDQGNLVLVIGDEVGTAEIKATFEGDDYFDAGEAVLTVKRKGPAVLGDQNVAEGWISEDVVAFDGPTKITFGYDDLALTTDMYGSSINISNVDFQDWPSALLQNNKVYASAFAVLSEYGYLDMDISEGFYSFYEESGYRLCYNPSELTPNWGSGAWDGDNFNPQPGTNCAGLLAFKVPAGQGTIIVKGYTDSEDAKMAIRLGLADAAPMPIAGGETDGMGYIMGSKEFTYSVSPSSPTWVYIYGVSLRPEDGYRGHIESITYLPEGTSMAKLSIMGNPIDEGVEYNENGVTVEWQSGFGGGIDGGDPEGPDPEGESALMPVITLDGATLKASDGPAIEVNSYDEVTIILKGHNTVSTTTTEEGVAAAISFGTMNGMDWEGCSRVIIEAGDEDASLIIPANSNIGLYNYNSHVSMYGFTGNIAGEDYGILLNGEGQGEGNSYFLLDESLKLKLRGGKAAFKSENGSWSDIYYDNCPLVEWDPESEDYPDCKYFFEEGQFFSYYEDNDNWETILADSPATYLKFSAPYFITKTPEGVAMKFEIGEENDCYVYAETYWNTYVNAIDRSYEGPVTIPETVIYEGVTYTVVGIEDGAFNNCSLTSLTIPESVNFIGESVLDDCSSLTKINCFATDLPYLGPHDYINSDVILYVPAGTKSAYDESDWAQYFDNGERIVEMSEIVPGDGNADGEGGVDINDAMAVMNHLLGQTPEGFDSEAANVNGDEEGVTITDLVLIIDMILRNNASDDGGE